MLLKTILNESTLKCIFQFLKINKNNNFQSTFGQFGRIKVKQDQQFEME